MNFIIVIIVAIAAILAQALARQPSGTSAANATIFKLEDRYQRPIGLLNFEQVGNYVAVTGTIKRIANSRINSEIELPSSSHGFHIHTFGRTIANSQSNSLDLGLLGDHWPGTSAKGHHGLPGGQNGTHAGDMGNIVFLPGSLSAAVNITLRDVRLDDILGRAVVIHADTDNGLYDDKNPNGFAGARVAYGIIARG
jgi:Cu/Zn superoxide dismutase